MLEELIHPMAVREDNYDWLGLETIPKHPYNPLLRADFDEDPARELVKFYTNTDYLGVTVQHLFNVTLLPYQLATLDVLWRKKMPMLIASRGFSKSYLLAIYCLLRLLLEPGCRIAIVGAGFRQSKNITDYMINIWQNAPVLQDITGTGRNDGPKREVDRVEFRIGKSVAYALPVGDGCVRWDTLTLNQKHFSTISERHGSIWGNGKFRDSDEHYDNGIKPTKIVTTRLGFSYEGTYNHKMKIVRDGIIKWVRTDEMVVGDRILIDRSERWHEGDFDCTIDEAYVLGSMIGDGYWTSKYKLGFATQDVDHFIPILNNVFLKKWVTYEKDPQHHLLHGIEERSDWISFWKLKNKCYAKDKTLPETILAASKDKMRACLQGLFDTDGHLQVNTARGGTSVSVNFTSTSKRLVEQMRFILLHFGIVSSVSSRDRNEKWNTAYELHITGKDAILFSERIGFRLRRKQNLLEKGIANKVRNISSEDTIPDVRLEMMRIANDYRGGDKCVNGMSRCKIAAKRNVTFDFAKLFLEKYGSIEDDFIVRLRTLCNDDIYYDTITSIKNSETHTYDMHVPDGHEYCANGFFSHNSKIRGMRANYILADEFSSMQEEIFNVVIRGFGTVSQNPIDRVKEQAMINKLKQIGKWNDELEKMKAESLDGNQIVISGTAYYAFNHFAKYWEQWSEIIKSHGNEAYLKETFGDEALLSAGLNWRDYAVIRIPYTEVPEGFLDRSVIAQAKAAVHSSQFLMEYCAVFPRDSNGFYKRTLLELCTTNRPIFTPSGEKVQFSAKKHGDPKRSYVIGVDPARSQDNAAIVVLELYPDHRRVVFCWSANEQKFKKLKKLGKIQEQDYYHYLARKIKNLMKVFNTERICLDSQGGGAAVQEALGDTRNCEDGELPIYEFIEENKEKDTDSYNGLHILEMIKPSSDYNSEANHGMLKDFETRSLLFPAFDAVELAKFIEIDKLNDLEIDTYEDLVTEVQELKDEIAGIECTVTRTGREHFDTQEVKIEANKTKRMRKDRYSAILYANKYGRDAQFAHPAKIDYRAVGGSKDVMISSKKNDHGTYTSVRGGFQNQDWLKRASFGVVKHQ